MIIPFSARNEGPGKEVPMTLDELRAARRGPTRHVAARIPELWVHVLLILFPSMTISEILRDLIWHNIAAVLQDPERTLRELLCTKLYRRLECVLDVLRLPHNQPEPPAETRQLLLPWYLREAA